MGKVTRRATVDEEKARVKPRVLAGLAKQQAGGPVEVKEPHYVEPTPKYTSQAPRAGPRTEEDLPGSCNR